jgi:hypothetical protein
MLDLSASDAPRAWRTSMQRYSRRWLLVPFSSRPVLVCLLCCAAVAVLPIYLCLSLSPCRLPICRLALQIRPTKLVDPARPATYRIRQSGASRPVAPKPAEYRRVSKQLGRDNRTIGLLCFYIIINITFLYFYPLFYYFLVAYLLYFDFRLSIIYFLVLLFLLSHQHLRHCPLCWDWLDADHAPCSASQNSPPA